MSVPLNYDGTPRKHIQPEWDESKFVTATSTWFVCDHDTGWYFTIYFMWGLFKKKLFWCDKCHHAIENYKKK